MGPEGEIGPYDLSTAAERTKLDAELIKEGAASYELVNGQMILQVSKEKIKEIRDNFKKETLSNSLRLIDEAFNYSGDNYKYPESRMTEAARELDKLNAQDILNLTSSERVENNPIFVELDNETSIPRGGGF